MRSAVRGEWLEAQDEQNSWSQILFGILFLHDLLQRYQKRLWLSLLTVIPVFQCWLQSSCSAFAHIWTSWESGPLFKDSLETYLNFEMLGNELFMDTWKLKYIREPTGKSKMCRTGSLARADRYLWGELEALVQSLQIAPWKQGLLITETEFSTQAHVKRRVCRIKSSVNKKKRKKPPKITAWNIHKHSKKQQDTRQSLIWEKNRHKPNV